MNHNLRLRWQIAKLKYQVELGRLKQDRNRNTEEVVLIHYSGRIVCRVSRCHWSWFRWIAVGQYAVQAIDCLTDWAFPRSSRHRNGGSCELNWDCCPPENLRKTPVTLPGRIVLWLMGAIEILWGDEKKRERERTLQGIRHHFHEAAMWLESKKRPPYLPANWSCIKSEAVSELDSFVGTSFSSAGHQITETTRLSCFLLRYCITRDRTIICIRSLFETSKFQSVSGWPSLAYGLDQSLCWGSPRFMNCWNRLRDTAAEA
jgi:hypothetical protein